MRPLRLLGVRIDAATRTPMMVLGEDGDGTRILPIMIGGAEAAAIHAALEGVVPPRPMTHDLIVDILANAGISVERVVISGMQEHTFLAELHLHGSFGERTVSARPSDAVALAARLGTPIFAADAVLDVAGVPGEHQPQPHPDASGGDDQQILDEFRSFLDDVSPDDFGG